MSSHWKYPGSAMQKMKQRNVIKVSTVHKPDVYFQPSRSCSAHKKIEDYMNQDPGLENLHKIQNRKKNLKFIGPCIIWIVE